MSKYTIEDTTRTIRVAVDHYAQQLRNRLDNGPHDALTATDAAMLQHFEAVTWHTEALDCLNGCATRPQDRQGRQRH